MVAATANKVDLVNSMELARWLDRAQRPCNDIQYQAGLPRLIRRKESPP